MFVASEQSIFSLCYILLKPLTITKCLLHAHISRDFSELTSTVTLLQLYLSENMATASRVLMVRPSRFCYNHETSLTNVFQKLLGEDSVEENTQAKALVEFQNLVHAVQSNGIEALIITDTQEPHTPDSIFPNNWISFHENGTLCLYPMYAINRRLERKGHVVGAIQQRFHVTSTLDLTHYEETECFLEGTGSMVLDRVNRVAYACISPRTDPRLFEEFCAHMNYRPVAFRGQDSFGRAIYHTNVMMSVADSYAIICLDAIKDADERAGLVQILTSTGKEVISIEFSQMTRFAGNALQLQNSVEKILFMSSQAYHSLRGDQIQRLHKHNRIVQVNVETIEVNGGGSVRCMMAEIFLPPKEPSE